MTKKGAQGKKVKASDENIQTLKAKRFETVLTEYFKENPFFYTDGEKGLWYNWNPERYCYEQSDLINITNSAIKIVTQKEAQAYFRIDYESIIKFFRSHEAYLFGRRHKPEECPNTWVQFKDRVFDTKLPLQHYGSPVSIKRFNKNPIPYPMSEDESTPTIDKLFTEWVGKEYKQTLYEIIAYCMLPDYPIHRFFVLIGSGNNGKSSYLQILIKFLGKNNCSSIELDRLLERFGTTVLYNKLAVIIGETNFNTLERTSLLKRITGGDEVEIEFKGKDIFYYKNYAKPIISTNTLPTTTDRTRGFYRRIQIVPFENEFTEKKDVVASIPEKEFHNLTRKCWNILLRLLKKREFSNEGTIEQRKELYEAHSNPIEQFVELCCNKDVEFYVETAKFHNAYKQYLVKKGHRIVQRKEMLSGLEDLGYYQTRTSRKVKEPFNQITGGEGENPKYLLTQYIDGLDLKPNFMQFIQFIQRNLTNKKKRYIDRELVNKVHKVHNSEKKQDIQKLPDGLVHVEEEVVNG